MTNPSLRTVSLQLSDNDHLGQVTVDEETFDRFTEDFDERLKKLVDAWKHLAAPIAQSRRQGANR